MRFSGIIPAAGMSSRMGIFKPLLPFNDSTIIENTVLSLINAKVDRLTVITGRNSEDMNKILSKYPVKTVYNNNYENTDMLSSIKLGLKDQTDSDAVFILPGDIPYVQPETLLRLKQEFITGNYDIIYPCCNGKKGHPPLICRNCYNTILEYNGNGGLKEVLSIYKDSSAYIEINDIGSVTDIDDKDDYKKLLNLINKA